MKKRLLVLAVIIAVFTGAGAIMVVNSKPVVPEQVIVEATKPTPPTRDELLTLVNAERAKVGVSPLVIDERLNWSAQEKADDMAEYKYFGHFSDKSPNQRGDARQWLLDSGVQCVASSENIVSSSTAAGAIDMWANSESHYKAMTDPKYSTTGIGVVFEDYIKMENITSSKPISGDMVNKYMIVQHFCQTP